MLGLGGAGATVGVRLPWRRSSVTTGVTIAVRYG